MAGKIYSSRELSAFCLQVSLLLKSAVPLDEGLSIMAEDAVSEAEKTMLRTMAEDVELGDPFCTALEHVDCFPRYVVQMASLGQQTGTLDQMMESLSVYYEKEDLMMKNIRNAVTYPVMMMGMLLVVLFVLFTRVMPVFEEVYAQLGVQISPLARSAFRFGGMFSGLALVLFLILMVLAAAAAAASGAGKTFYWSEKLKEWMKQKSLMAQAAAGRRFTAVLGLTLQSGMELEKGMEIAKDMVDNRVISDRIAACSEKLQDGVPYYEAMKETGLFSGFHIQMIRVGARSGHLDVVMHDISEDYEQQADAYMDQMVSRLEPTMVAVLAVAVGLVLLSVMLPLAGILASVG